MRDRLTDRKATKKKQKRDKKQVRQMLRYIRAAVNEHWLEDGKIEVSTPPEFIADEVFLSTRLEASTHIYITLSLSLRRVPKKEKTIHPIQGL